MVEIVFDNDAIDPICDDDVTGHIHVGQSMYQGIPTTGRHFLYCIHIITIYTICTILHGVLHDQETKDQTCLKNLCKSGILGLYRKHGKNEKQHKRRKIGRNQR